MNKTEYFKYYFLSLIIISLYCFCIAPYGFHLMDEGQLSQSAKRILNSERPFVDFDEPYTGGLAYLHAWIFSTFGEKLIYTRYFLIILIAASVWPVYSLVARYYVARQSFLITCLIFLTTCTSYSVAMPTWHMTMLGLWTLYFFILYQQNNKSIFLLLCGVSSGLAILFKINAVLLLIAAGYSLLFKKIRELRAESRNSRNGANYIVSAILVLLLTLYIYILSSKIFISFNTSSIVLYLFPSLIISIVILKQLAQKITFLSLSWFLDVIKHISILVLPAFLILFLYLYKIYSLREIGLIREGLLFNPSKRIIACAKLPDNIWIFLGSATFIIASLRLYVLASNDLIIRRCSYFLIVIAIVICLNKNDLFTYMLYGLSVMFIPVFTIHLYSTQNSDHSVIFTGIFYAIYSLVQFPYFNQVYFLYAMPFLYLYIFTSFSQKITNLIRENGEVSLLLIIVIGILCNTLTSRPFIISKRPAVQSERLANNESLIDGLTVNPEDIDFMWEMRSFLASNIKGKKLLILDNLPIYYLLGFQNPTRIIYEDLSTYSDQHICDYYRSFDFDAILALKESKYMHLCNFKSHLSRYALTKSFEFFDLYEKTN